MGRTLSSPTSTATAKTITRPRYLLQAAFSFVARYSSGDDITIMGADWISANLQVGAIQEQANGSVSVSVVIGNSDLAFGALCLNEAPQDRAVDILAYYEGATADDDPVKIFSGVIGDCLITEAAVILQLVSLNARSMFIPRRRITRDAGFNHLTPSGRIIEFNGQRYELKRG